MKPQLLKIKTRLKICKFVVPLLFVTQAAFGAPFITQDSGTTVLDEKTGLIWQRCSIGQADDFVCSGTLTPVLWADALTYCNGLTLAGRIWRLPNINELETIVDRSKASGLKIDLTVFPAAASVYWSSSSFVPGASSAWIIHFGQGGVYPWNKNTLPFAVRCVSTL